MTRMFAFGCSFTQYWRWPTWADMLGQQADFYENWGLCGAGNSYILYSLIECAQRHNLGADDQVLIMWTNTSREDRYVRDHWMAGGNVYWDGHPLGREFVKTWSCERGYLIRDLAAITAARHLLQSWRCDWRFFSMVPLTHTNAQNQLADHPDRPGGPDRDVRDFYHDTLATIEPSVLDTVFRGEWFTGSGLPDAADPSRRDFHPTPLEHLAYIDSVAPELITQARTRDWMMAQHAAATTGDLKWSEPCRPQHRL
jgi:hypothetical protein